MTKDFEAALAEEIARIMKENEASPITDVYLAIECVSTVVGHWALTFAYLHDEKIKALVEKVAQVLPFLAYEVGDGTLCSQLDDALDNFTKEQTKLRGET